MESGDKAGNDQDDKSSVYCPSASDNDSETDNECSTITPSAERKIIVLIQQQHYSSAKRNPKSNKVKVSFIAWWWKVCTNATDSRTTRWKNYKNFVAQNSPTPSHQLVVCNVSIYFVLGTFVRMTSVLLPVLKPSSLQYPSI